MHFFLYFQFTMNIYVELKSTAELIVPGCRSMNIVTMKLLELSSVVDLH